MQLLTSFSCALLSCKKRRFDILCCVLARLALLAVDVDVLTGRPVGAATLFSGLQDPGQPISSKIEVLTGITNAMVCAAPRGKGVSAGGGGGR